MAFILVVEDEPLVAVMLTSVLRDAGHEVEAAPNGLVAVESVRRRKPDLAIVDFMMPIMTGQEFAVAVRRDEALAGMPIILVTGVQGAIGRVHPELFQAVLDKPYRRTALLDEVDRLTGTTVRT